MLTDELSPAAAGLYEKLLAVGPGRLSAGDEDPEVVTELVEAGFVLRHGSGRLDAVEPAYVAYDGPGPARGLPPEWVERGITVREVYTRAYLSDPELRPFLDHSDGPGHHIRICSTLPLKLVVVDEREALVPLDPTGMTGAMVVRSPVVLAALRALFEHVWREARPVHAETPEGGDGPGRDGRRLLDLLLTGAKDEAIARTVGVSVRTVRRRIGALERLAGVDNRLALVVAATRAGWLD